MKKTRIISTVVRGFCALLLIAQVAGAQTPSAIDNALKQKAEMLSPELARQIAIEREEQRKESEDLTMQAIGMIDEGKWKEAYYVLYEAVQRNPDNITAKSKLNLVNSQLYDVYAGYGKDRQDVKDYEAAISNYRLALLHKPTGKDAINGIIESRKKLEELISKNLGKIITDDMSDND